MLIAAALAVLFQGTPATPPVATPQDTLSAYLDRGAANLLRAARERRARVERAIDSYGVTARQRVHVGVEALTRDRTLFGGEMAARIEWRRGETGVVRVLGGREVSPATSRGAQVPDDLGSETLDMAFDPDELQLSLFAFGAGNLGQDAEEEEQDDKVVERDGDSVSVEVEVEPIDPLGPGSEAHYRFRSGDTTVVRLPDGSQLRLIQLEIIPRRREFQLLRGTLWIDSQTHGVARSVLTTARPFDLRRDAGGDVPRAINTFGAIRATVRYVTVEYQLVQGRWWLPRLSAIHAEANLGFVAGVPVRFERSYSDYEVQASAMPQQAPVSVLAQRDTGAYRVCRREAEPAGEVCSCEGDRCRRWRVEVPSDTAALLASPDLPPPLADEGARLITGEEVESLASVLVPRIGRMGDFRPELETRIADLRLLRYNRVEGLSIGARADVAYGPFAVDGEARIGLADREPGVEIGISRETMVRRMRVAGYRRLTPFDPSARAFGFGSSLNALLFGRDEADYFRATGAELTSQPVTSGRWTYTWRAFGEHQHAVSRETQFTLARAWESEPFREVRGANDADQAGLGITLSRDFGGDRSPARFTLGTAAEGQTGTFGFGRGQLFGRLGLPSLGRFAVALEGAAGTTTGDVPVQGLWYLGGPTTVRGYEGALVGGEAFWRARAEVGTPLPAARLVLFSDAGWAGARDGWDWDPPLLSAGIGASFLDGLLRFDVARALREPRGWRVDLYLDAAL
ncbi:BamA/TamA family outer membrane protein [Longimicrobium sp.]|uniref:BamA/TamA family outer membrane protein n=1 Tax=Longimicrobium sp. TaxID=2029185 RepID=UPI003B3BB9AE